MLNPMEFNKINDFQQFVTHTHSEKNIYTTPTFGVSRTYQTWETNPQDRQMTYPEAELSTDHLQDHVGGAVCPHLTRNKQVLNSRN